MEHPERAACPGDCAEQGADGDQRSGLVHFFHRSLWDPIMGPVDLKTHIDAAVQAIGAKAAPEIGTILGPALGGRARAIQTEQKIPYEKTPHFAKSTVASHKGDLIL